MIVERITEINNTVFDTIYDANSASIIENTGYDDKENLRKTFSSEADNFYLFSFTKEATEMRAAEVTGYVQAFGKGDEITVYNSVTKSTSVLIEAVSGSNVLLKSLGFTYLNVDCVKDTSMYNYIKAACNRLDLFEYISEQEREDDIIIKLRLL
ncbi:MAG: hypothetical protein Unbinned3329contig1000_21 [Prokaryotic dsDNA virus sp.]|jgi:hypothetical protein|nr:MAG: hypothetical protein Unbinned3329contig1000_21 [Prokaryotic dsDNA virus sp.]|tara:strand:- start:1423 stop:1884 length:462 start_codon:yes stop_codon:yes gene_type:complete